MKSINQKSNIEKFSKMKRMTKSNRAVLINETSVYKEYAIPKNSALTSNGYFDIIQIPNLRVYAGKFLCSTRSKIGITQNEFSQKYNFAKTALRHWEKDRCRVPLVTILRIAEDNRLTKEDLYRLIKEKNIQTKKRVNLYFKYTEIVRILPFLAKSSKNTLIIKESGKKHISLILGLFNTKVYRSPNGQFIIKNTELSSFLETFFTLRTIIKINPLTSKFVRSLKNINLKKAVICPLLQTDGSGCLDKRKRLYFVSFKNISKELHDILVTSMYLTYKILPSSYLLKEKIKNQNHSQGYVTKYNGKILQPIYNDLVKLCGNFKTSKYHSQSVKAYRKESKPHLYYLLKAKKNEKIVALRIWASTEGAIIPMRRNAGGLIVPKLQISCANKRLLFQLRKIAKSVGLHFTIGYEKRIGYKSIYNMAISCTLSFLKLGGFIKDIKISKNSKYYEGIDKQDLTYSILEYMKRERENVSLKKSTLKNIHENIGEIARNREFKEINYYNRFFSKNSKVRKCLTH